MIYRIFSTLPSFKSLEFHNGLNILLADKSPKATERHTRNRAGKTSLIEIIHFLTGANLPKDSIFRTEELSQASFGMELDLSRAKIVVERTGQNSSKVVLRKIVGRTDNWPFHVVPDILGEYPLTNRDWRRVLGQLMFGVVDLGEDAADTKKYRPSFRSLYSYFVRKQSDNAFTTPFQNSSEQATYNTQVSLSYLLELDWTIPQEWEYVRAREKTLKELKKAANEGALGEAIETTAKLRTELIVAERKYSALKDQIGSFNVLPEYKELETEASTLTRQLNQLANENAIDRELASELDTSLVSETPPSQDNLEALYKEVGLVLPDAVPKRFDEVSSFHEAVIRNRRLYLTGELQSAQNRIQTREQEMRKIEARWSQIMTILRSHGAMDQLLELQAELARHESNLQSLRRRYSAAEQLEGLKSELEIERQKLHLRLRQNYQEQEGALKKAIVAFEDVSKALYEDAGSLTIDTSTNGPIFDVQIHGSRSKGISNMQIFCFDMMLMRIWAEKEEGTGYLVHDSHLFDGVDERQVSKALYVGAEMAEKFGFQYIVTLNSDQVRSELFKENGLSKYLLPVRLTDATVDGGLFGIRFN
jgi:uncharacterized protein YydD (DUF2326 family)